jgi:hypothetical protein
MRESETAMKREKERERERERERVVFLATFPFSKSLNLGVRVIRPFRGHVNGDAMSRRPVLETRRSLSNNKSRLS